MGIFFALSAGRSVELKVLGSSASSALAAMSSCMSVLPERTWHTHLLYFFLNSFPFLLLRLERSATAFSPSTTGSSFLPLPGKRCREDWK
jgi:hypothetical protein